MLSVKEGGLLLNISKILTFQTVMMQLRKEHATEARELSYPSNGVTSYVIACPLYCLLALQDLSQITRQGFKAIVLVLRYLYV